MKYLIPLLFLLSCVPEQKRNAEITTMYNGVVEFHANPHWNSEIDLREALTDEQRPDFIIFSADWCEACHVLRDVIVSSGWRSKEKSGIISKTLFEWRGLTPLFRGFWDALQRKHKP